jgi:hypothetical protein
LIEGLAHFGMELGHHVRLIKDATAAFDKEGIRGARCQRAALRAVLSTVELLPRLP